jgi:hypothetical protein
MKKKSLFKHNYFPLGTLLILGFTLIAGCIGEESPSFYDTPTGHPENISPPDQTIQSTASPHPKLNPPPTLDKWDLWTNGTQLRGANIWQRIVIPELDGPEFLGSEYIGPPYSQEDFNRLAALGANYVNISGPGLYTEEPPYQLDLRV